MTIPYQYRIQTVPIYTDTDTDTDLRHRADTETKREKDKDLDSQRENGTVEGKEGAVSGLWKIEAELSKPALSLKDAAFLSNKSEDTITRWAKKYGIGKQLHKGASWRIDPVGLAIVLEGDADALATFQSERARR